MTSKIHVMVDGLPVEAELSFDQVRDYLRAKGWECERDDEEIEAWVRTSVGGKATRVWVGQEDAESLHHVLHDLASYEERHRSAILRDIAGLPAMEANDVRPCAVDPSCLSAGSIHKHGSTLVEADGHVHRKVRGLVRVFFDDSDRFADLDERTRCALTLNLPTGTTALVREAEGRVVLQGIGEACDVMALPYTLAQARGRFAVKVETTERDAEGRVLWRPACVESWEQEARRLRSELAALGARDVGPSAVPEPAQMDGDDGPVCACGKPSSYESGWCGGCGPPEIVELRLPWNDTKGES